MQFTIFLTYIRSFFSICIAVHFLRLLRIRKIVRRSRTTTSLRLP